MVAWPTAFFCLTYRAKPVADSRWQPTTHTARHSPLLPTFRLPGSHPCPSYRWDDYKGDAYWFSLLSAPDHSESHPLLLIPDLAYLLSGRRPQEQNLLHIGSMAPFPPCSISVGTLLSSPVTDKKTLSRKINPESCYQKTLKKLLQ